MDRVAWTFDFERLSELTYGELEGLFMALNRTRYKLEEQEEFIQLYLMVHRTLVDSRVRQHGTST